MGPLAGVGWPFFSRRRMGYVLYIRGTIHYVLAGDEELVFWGRGVEKRVTGDFGAR